MRFFQGALKMQGVIFLTSYRVALENPRTAIVFWDLLEDSHRVVWPRCLLETAEKREQRKS